MVYAVDSASFIFLRDPLVNEEVEETMDAFGLGYWQSRHLREGVSSFVRRDLHESGGEGDRLF